MMSSAIDMIFSPSTTAKVEFVFSPKRQEYNLED